MFSISFCLYRACFTHLISSNLSCNPCLWYYDQLVPFGKEINANVYRHSLREYYKRFYCSFEWHLTPHMTLYIETCIRWTPCIKQTLQHSPFTALKFGLTTELEYKANLLGIVGGSVVPTDEQPSHWATKLWNLDWRTTKPPLYIPFSFFKTLTSTDEPSSQWNLLIITAIM